MGNAAKLSRTPPVAVLRALRKEVQFGCPVPGCGCPFLEWHHFDPPWSERNHHDLSGMIALCSRHHPLADGGAYSVEQLREFKTLSASTPKSVVRERFDWLRKRVVVRAGSNVAADCLGVLDVDSEPAIWLSRDPKGHALLNFDFNKLTLCDERRPTMLEGFWTADVDGLSDLECPPSGRLLRVKYANGDDYRIEFEECKDSERLIAKFGPMGTSLEPLLPFLLVDARISVGGSETELGDRFTQVPRHRLSDNFLLGSAGKAAINIPKPVARSGSA
jgi:hypothetical protein